MHRKVLLQVRGDMLRVLLAIVARAVEFVRVSRYTVAGHSTKRVQAHVVPLG